MGKITKQSDLDERIGRWLGYRLNKYISSYGSFTLFGFWPRRWLVYLICGALGEIDMKEFLKCKNSWHNIIKKHDK